MNRHPLLKEAGNLLNQMRDIRRDLHRHPELGTREVRTSRIVADYLEALGLDVRTGIGGHGVVATLSSGEGEKCIALRADMDALPIEEKKYRALCFDGARSRALLRPRRAHGHSVGDCQFARQIFGSDRGQRQVYFSTQ